MRSMAMQANVEHKMFFLSLWSQVSTTWCRAQTLRWPFCLLVMVIYIFSNVCKHLDEHWTCKQAQKCHFCFRMNSTFRAYLLPERPKLRSQKHRVRWTLSLWFNFLRFVCWNSCGLQLQCQGSNGAKDCRAWGRHEGVLGILPTQRLTLQVSLDCLDNVSIMSDNVR